MDTFFFVNYTFPLNLSFLPTFAQRFVDTNQSLSLCCGYCTDISPSFQISLSLCIINADCMEKK